MLKKLLAIVALLHIGLIFAQNSPKPPASPFSFQNGQTVVRADRLPNQVQPLILDTNTNVNVTNSNANQSLSVNNCADGHIRSLSEYMSDPLCANEPDFDPKEINNISDKVLKQFKDDMADYTVKLMPYTLRLFYTLSLISVILCIIMNLIFGSNFKELAISIMMIFFYSSL